MSVYTDNFKTIFGTKNNIHVLRNKVLELAIQGKLVEQDSNDEPALELVKKIEAEKCKMVKDGMIKKEKPLSKIEDDEIPFNIPESWEWVRFGNVGFTQTGTTPKTSIAEYFDGDVPFIKPADISSKEINYDNESLTQLGVNVGRLIKKNSNMMVCIGGSIGKTYFTDRDCSCNQQINTLTPFLNVNYLYTHLLMSSPYFYNQVWSKSSGTATPIINKSTMESIIIPLPPENEQQRIVNRIKSLMTEIDKIEEVLKKKEHILELLPKMVVDVIGKCQNGEELKEHLQFVIDNFETIYQTPNSMQELRNVILQLAIEGKLVPLDKNDEPASELVKKIRTEKDRLVNEGKIKKEKSLPKIEDDEIPFEIPESWEWVKAGELCDVINYGYTASAIQNNTGTKLLRITDIQNGKVEWDNVPFCEIDNEKVGQYKLNKNDIVIARTGGTVGKSFIIKNVNTQAVYASYLIRMISNKNLNPDYYYLMLNSPLYWTQISDGARGGAQPNVNAQMLSNLILPLPPLAEQHRIVQKVESIMSLIDQMENKLKRKSGLVEKMANI